MATYARLTEIGQPTLRQPAPHRTYALPLFIAVSILVGLLLTWAERYQMGSDGVSYLDLGDAWWRGDWRNAVNGLWSPLYPAYIGGVLKLFTPSMNWEFPLVHLANFALFLGSLAAFCFFVNAAFNLAQAHRPLDAGPEALPWSVLWTAAGCIFLTSAVMLITVSPTTPDTLVAASFYLAVGWMARILVEPERTRGFLLLGLVLGLGYLAKAPMLPLAVLMFATLAVKLWSVPGAWARLLSAAAVFALVIAPYVLMLSTVKGHFTMGESGSLNYAWHVNGIPRFHWRGQSAGSGTAVHPTRQLNVQPAVYEFGEPVRGTYPIWYDAAYWNEGLRPRANIRGQIKVISSALSTYYHLFTKEFLGALVALVALAFVAGRRLFGAVWEAWPVLLPAVCGFAMYALVHAEARYLGALAAVLLVVPLVFLRLPSRDVSVASKIILAGAAILVFTFAGSALHASTAHGDSVHGQIAAELQRVGVHSGEKVAYIHSVAEYGNYPWARLARVRIAAEITAHDAPGFWKADAAEQLRILNLLRGAGIAWVVAGAPSGVAPEHWLHLGSTDHYLYQLRP